MKLYEIEESINDILNTAEVNEETGEVLIDYAKLEALEMEKEQKIENVINYYLDLDGDSEKFANEIHSLTQKKKTLENKKDSLKRFLDSIHNGFNADYGTHSIKYRASKRLEGEDLTVLPEDCIKIEKKPIAEAIKAYLKSGKLLVGWEVVENKNIQIK